MNSIVTRAPARWRANAEVSVLRHRAELLTRVREFFAARAVWEVETPILSQSAATDPQIESLCTRVNGRIPAFLHTSPEFAMKRLLASGSGDIFQICKVFRDAELGRWHSPEFTMIEWYRLGMDDQALMGEVEALVTALLAPARQLPPAERLSYRDALRRHAGVDMAVASDEELSNAVRHHRIECSSDLDRDARLDLLMGLVVGPQLGVSGPCFICDYPASQAALARIKPGPAKVAARFELYLDGLELANGFHELTDATQQRARFERDLAARKRRQQPVNPPDEHFLAALGAGMPDCAGVALGFDRLTAIAAGVTELSAVLAFPFESA